MIFRYASLVAAAAMTTMGAGLADAADGYASGIFCQKNYVVGDHKYASVCGSKEQWIRLERAEDKIHLRDSYYGRGPIFGTFMGAGPGTQDFTPNYGMPSGGSAMAGAGMFAPAGTR